MTNSDLRFLVNDEPDGRPVDLVVAKHCQDLSRRQVRRILDRGGIFIDQTRVRRASETVFTGHTIRIRREMLATVNTGRHVASDSIEILFDEGNVVVVNKPPHVLSQPTTKSDSGSANLCITKLVKQRLATIQHSEQPNLHLCHRLDKETSGALILARNHQTMTWITDQFRQREIKKTYLAICIGKPTEQRWSQRCYLSRIDSKTGRVREVFSGGRLAQSRFEVEVYSPHYNLALIRCFPETGRSHQLRIHLHQAGLPILGDKSYGFGVPRSLPEVIRNTAAQHQMLHSSSISFTPLPEECDPSHPKKVFVEASAPNTFETIAQIIKNYKSR